MSFEFVRDDVAERRHQHLLRQHAIIDEEHESIIRVDGRAYINFASNDYLGLRQHPDVLQAWVEGLAQFGGSSGASPLVTGYSRAHQQLSDALATLTNRDAVTLFSSGYAANHAICHALFKDSGTIIADKLSHASLIEGARSSKAAFLRYRHNDYSHLTERLKSVDDNDILVATESVFSMDGDQCDMPTLINQTREYDAWLMVDDAHGFGVVGDKGQGLAAFSSSQDDCQIIMATLGKACGTGGAFIASNQALHDYLINFSKHYVYSTAMSPAQAHATLTALKLIQHSERRERLTTNIALFKQEMAKHSFQLLDSGSAIQPVVIGSPEDTLAMSSQLKSLGVWVGAMRYPTVPKNSDRLRVTLNAQHHEQDVLALVDALCIARDALS